MLYIFDTIIDETAVARVNVADNGARERFTLLLCADEQPVNHTNQAYLGPIPRHRRTRHRITMFSQPHRRLISVRTNRRWHKGKDECLNFSALTSIQI